MTVKEKLRRSIEKLARKYSGLPYCDYEDLVGEAWLGALEALQRYDRTRDTTSLTWALTGARGAIRHYIRDQFQLRGVPAWRQERRDGNVKESFIDDVLRYDPATDSGESGTVDRVAMGQFIDTLPDREAAVCRRVLGGQAWYPALGAEMPAYSPKAWIIRTRVRRKLCEFLVSGRQQERFMPEELVG